jgi:hypothetical protein
VKGWSERVAVSGSGGFDIDLQAALDGYSLWMQYPFSGAEEESILAEPTLVGMWTRLAQKHPLFKELSKVAERVLAIPASEAESERVVGKIKKIFGDHSFRYKSKAMLARLRIATAG